MNSVQQIIISLIKGKGIEILNSDHYTLNPVGERHILKFTTLLLVT